MQATTNQPSSAARRKWILTVVILGLFAVSCGALYLYNFSPPKPWVVRWQISRYLKEQTGNGDFKVNFPFPSKADMAKSGKKEQANGPAKGSKTGKDFETLRAEYLRLKTSVFAQGNELTSQTAELKEKNVQLENLTKQLADAQANNATNLSQLQASVATFTKRIAELEKTVTNRVTIEKDIHTKEEALVPIESDLWEFQKAFAANQAATDASSPNVLAKARTQLSQDMRKKLDEAKTYAAIYRVIGEDLYVAGRLLESGNVDHQRMALGMVLQAIQFAMDDAQNNWLAARICEGYIWPNLDAAEDGRRSPISYDNLLSTCANVFRQEEEYANMVRNYEWMLSSTNRARVDWARVQIAFAYDQAGDFQKALSTIREVKNTNDYRWVMTRFVPRWEQQAKYNANR